MKSQLNRIELVTMTWPLSAWNPKTTRSLSPPQSTEHAECGTWEKMAANRYNSVAATIATIDFWVNNNCYPTFGSVSLHVGEKWGVVLALSFHLLFRIVEKWFCFLQIWWGHELDINSINFHKNGNNFVTCSEDKTMRLWDIRADQEIAQYKAPTPNSTFTCCGISVSGRLIFASSDDASIH